MTTRSCGWSRVLRSASGFSIRGTKMHVFEFGDEVWIAAEDLDQAVAVDEE